MTLLIGCKGEQKKKTDENPNLIKPQMVLRSQDTTQVRRLTRQFLHCLQQKDVPGALNMLRRYDHGEVRTLEPAEASKQAMVFGMFAGMPSYDIDHIIFYKEDDSEVKFTVTMFERTDSADRRPNKASFLIRPVRIGGEWYLTLADTQNEHRKSEIKH